jgi:hypothetical protein
VSEIVSPRPGAAESPRGGSVRLAECLEDGGVLFRGDADARVGHDEMQLGAPVGAGVFADLEEDMAGRRELDGVAEQIGEHLADPKRVAEDRGGDGRIQVAQQLEAFLLGRQRHRLQQLVHDRGDREGHVFELEAAGLDLREVEDVVENRQQRLRRQLHGREALPLFRRQLAVEREAGHAQDAVHRRPDLVAHVGEELAFRAARFHRLVARADEVGVAGAQLGGPRFDRLLEPLLVVLELQIALPGSRRASR